MEDGVLLTRLGELELQKVSLRRQIDTLQNLLDDAEAESSALKVLVTKGWTKRPGNLSVVDAAYQLLYQTQRPVHYKELYEALKENLVVIPGKAPLSNLVVQLSRDSRFERVERGMYGLTEWSSNDESQKLALTSNRNNLLAIEAERDNIKATRKLEMLEVEIRLAQMNLKQLREQLKHDNPGRLLPDLDPAVTVQALQDRLATLLEQRELLRSDLTEDDEKGAI